MLRKPPKGTKVLPEYSEQIAIRTSRSQRRWVEVICRQSGMSITEFFRSWIDLISGYRPSPIEALTSREAAGYYKIFGVMMEGIGMFMNDLAKLASGEDVRKTRGRSILRHWKRVEKLIDQRMMHYDRDDELEGLVRRMEEGLRDLREREVGSLDITKKGSEDKESL